MIIDLLDYIKEIRYKKTSILDVDYDFYDDLFYLYDLEEVLECSK